MSWLESCHRSRPRRAAYAVSNKQREVPVSTLATRSAKAPPDRRTTGTMMLESQAGASLPTAERRRSFRREMGQQGPLHSGRQGSRTDRRKFGAMCDQATTVKGHPLPRVRTRFVGEPEKFFAPLVYRSRVGYGCDAPASCHRCPDSFLRTIRAAPGRRMLRDDVRRGEPTALSCRRKRRDSLYRPRW